MRRYKWNKWQSGIKKDTLEKTSFNITHPHRKKLFLPLVEGAENKLTII